MLGDITGETKEELINRTRIEVLKDRLAEMLPPILFTAAVVGMGVLASRFSGNVELLEEEEEGSYILAKPNLLNKVYEEGATYLFWIDQNGEEHHSAILEDGTDA
ncbi:hypothetical protein SEA_GIRLPOWER_40 [Streptomyces phage GirlPower]|nr:hypothetical protein SEA_GIRLPOWER_40 [Streptomyces phage GirlPower]